MSEWVITLLADPARERLTGDTVQAAAKAIGGNAVTLKEGVAAEIVVKAGMTVEEVEKELGTLKNLRGAYDFILQPFPRRRKKLLICDMDSTMITVECIDELADFVGKKAEVAAITERAMNGELDFVQALTERVALLAGLPESALQRCYDERVTFTPGARALVQGMRARGAHTVLVSGGFTFFTSRVAAELGFHEHHANVLEVSPPSPRKRGEQGGVLTGRVIPPILGKEAKLKTLQDTCTRLGITPADALAVGDGANDVPMLLAAGLGVAYRAKPAVQAQVAAKLNYADLGGLIWVAG